MKTECTSKGVVPKRIGALSTAPRAAAAVAETNCLLYRGWLVGQTLKSPTPCRLPVGDTADCQSALQGFTAPVRRSNAPRSERLRNLFWRKEIRLDQTESN
jgi:hypothetical protein